MAARVSAMADRVEELLAGFDADQTPQRARERAEELVRTIVGFYGEGLERLLTIAHQTLGDEASEAVFARLSADKLVESLLCLHGLHPVSLEDRIDAALQSVLPYVKSHEGNMEVSRIEGDVVYLRLERQLRRMSGFQRDAENGRRACDSGARPGNSRSARRTGRSTRLPVSSKTARFEF